jgi:hypothetical protein
MKVIGSPPRPDDQHTAEIRSNGMESKPIVKFCLSHIGQRIDLKSLLANKN